jgi:hypothetical protein
MNMDMAAWTWACSIYTDMYIDIGMDMDMDIEMEMYMGMATTRAYTTCIIGPAS